MSDCMLSLQMIPRLRVLARSKPEDKQALVNWLKAHGEVVAATGTPHVHVHVRDCVILHVLSCHLMHTCT